MPYQSRISLLYVRIGKMVDGRFHFICRDSWMNHDA